jgi:DNA-binding transcriptional LysR family regulator
MDSELDLSRVDLNLLVLFEAIERERHIGRAAERLNLSPSAVSHGLGRLRRLLNDPLFQKYPKGVAPTRRALELASPISEALARVRSVIAAAEPFDPATSRRRFHLGAPDGVLAFVLPALIARLAHAAPQIDLAARLLMPFEVPAALDSGAVEVALTPLGDLPARFCVRRLYDDEWAVAMRAGHPLAGRLDLDSYCRAGHLVVSLRGDPVANIDQELAAIGRRRRVASTAPHLLLGLQLAGESDLLIAAPAQLARRHAAGYGLSVAAPPRSPVSTSARRSRARRAAIRARLGCWPPSRTCGRPLDAPATRPFLRPHRGRPARLGAPA